VLQPAREGSRARRAAATADRLRRAGSAAPHHFPALPDRPFESPADRRLPAVRNVSLQVCGESVRRVDGRRDPHGHGTGRGGWIAGGSSGGRVGARPGRGDVGRLRDAAGSDRCRGGGSGASPGRDRPPPRGGSRCRRSELTLRLLAVEDSATQAEALRVLLEEQGYDVTLATSAEAALDLLGTSEFDLVLSDVMMPGITGYELCSRIKQDPRLRRLPVVLLTSLADPMAVVRGLECGADNYITKPYDPEHLFARLRHVLDNRRFRQ